VNERAADAARRLKRVHARLLRYGDALSLGLFLTLHGVDFAILGLGRAEQR
jgi:hypothetical protein